MKNLISKPRTVKPKTDAEHIRNLEREVDSLTRQLVTQNETIEAKNLEIANLNQDNKRLRLDLQNSLTNPVTI